MIDDGDNGNYDSGSSSETSCGESGNFDAGNTSGESGGFDAGNTSGESGGFDAGNISGEGGGFDAGNTSGESGGFDAGNISGESGGFDAGNTSGESGGFDAKNTDEKVDNHETETTDATNDHLNTEKNNEEGYSDTPTSELQNKETDSSINKATEKESDEKNTTNVENSDIITEKSIAEKQEVANKTAQEYNEKFSPFERAKAKGYTDISETPNGGVSFENSDALYVTENGTKGIVTIEASGNRTRDFDLANSKLGLDETPEGYTWHHVDNYDAQTNTMTLELVETEAHNASKPHSGACAQYDAINGPSYNPAKKG